jgi:hypothetical protein
MITTCTGCAGETEAASPPLILLARAAQATGPPLRPQGSLPRSLTRRPTAALDPGDLCDPWAGNSAGRPEPAPPGTRREPKIPLIKVSTVSGDCRTT